jgi:DNA-binding winged helix-turn-helix (wHTH) protein
MTADPTIVTPPQLLVATRHVGHRRRLAAALEAAGWTVRQADDSGTVAAVLGAAGAEVAVIDLTPRRMTLGALHLDRDRQEVRVYGHEVAVTRVEFALLDRLCDPPGRVRSREELGRAVHGEQRPSGGHAVDVHLSNLRRKLQRHAPAVRFIHTARGVGFRLGDDLLGDSLLGDDLHDATGRRGQQYSASSHHS